MTKKEKLAYDFGKSFDISLVPDGYKTAPCFDDRMCTLVTEARTESGSKRNNLIMQAWYKGLKEKENT